mmetsp:Transcript_95516/g.273995  ORF Transcript_95516/g.273995 Transcript_95516/m.273995 type:complete len:516 (-) Transcript_95516:65-1612(-)
MAPKRVRRTPAELPGQQILWDIAAAADVLDACGAKRSHARPLLRVLSARFVEGAGRLIWEGLGTPPPGGCGDEGKLSTAPETVRWQDLGVVEDLLTASGLPQRSSAALLAAVSPVGIRPVGQRVSADGSTTKLILELRDGHRVETVIMRHEGRTTVCVSSQVGCQMGCTFCATGTMPIVGDLDAAEIVEQVLHAHAIEVAAGRPPVRNAVFMGMGEPLNNWRAVSSALQTLTDNACLGKYSLPPSRVTVSTVGVVPRMLQLAEEFPAVNLALSLHAPTQELREQIVPSAKQTPLSELLSALDAHAASRRHSPGATATMVEYVLLAGVNDTEACALELARLMAPRAKEVMVNLIPFNPGASTEAIFSAPSHPVVERFQQLVAACGVTVRVRREMGQDIAGACGQLALASKEGSADGVAAPAADVEDFVAWRRRQPKEDKAARNVEYVATVAAAATASAGKADGGKSSQVPSVPVAWVGAPEARRVLALTAGVALLSVVLVAIRARQRWRGALSVPT